MASSVDSLASLSYGIGFAGFVLFALQLVWKWRGGAAAGLMLGAVVVSAAWEGSGLLFAIWRADEAWRVHQFADAARVALWFAFLRSLGQSPLPAAQSLSAFIRSGAGVGVLTLATLVVLLALFPMIPASDWGVQPHGYAQAYGLMLAASIIGLAMTENLFRNTPTTSRWALKPLCLGLGAVFAFDLFLFSDALMLQHLDPDLWGVRGLVHALAIPFLGLSAVRNRSWTIDIHLSRQLVFRSTAILASGFYLLAVAAAGYYVRLFGGDWGKAIQAVFLFVALLGLAWVFFSGTLRSTLRVLVNKHFFSYRYDYRNEWLHFTRLLSTPDPHLGVQERCVKALADLVESPGGAIFLPRAGGIHFVQAGRWNMAALDIQEPSDGALAAFLRTTAWVIDLSELRHRPERYKGLATPAWLESLSGAWLVVPLMSGDDLLGFVVLATPRTPVEVNWEVLDLLKTAARQAAGFIAQIRANEALLETRKFDAFNRMSAFVVHDLKNLVAQLSLLLKNAERHRNNPEFQSDMLETVEHVVTRMSALLLQLRSGATPVAKPGLVDLAPVARRICDARAREGRKVTLEVAPDALALGHEDRLERVIGHLVQNALDATPETGRVILRVYAEDQMTIVEVWDNGKGMSPEFVRNQLFKPFQTTKQTGMGIGFYESAQYVSELGGKIGVESQTGEGTRVKVTLPRHAGVVVTDAETKVAA
jgi:putative PEP-CTERM system histidine kinase